MFRNKRSFGRPAPTRAARRRRARHALPARPPAFQLPLWGRVGDPQEMEELWGAAALELEVVVPYPRL